MMRPKLPFDESALKLDVKGAFYVIDHSKAISISANDCFWNNTDHYAICNSKKIQSNYKTPKPFLPMHILVVSNRSHMIWTFRYFAALSNESAFVYSHEKHGSSAYDLIVYRE